MQERYRLRVRKDVDGLGQVTVSLEVEAISKLEAKRQLKAIVHTSWRWLELVKLKDQSTYADLGFKCPKCGGGKFSHDHDDISNHAPGGEDGSEPQCVSCPVWRCDGCREVLK